MIQAEPPVSAVVPAEWARHHACWTAWPHIPDWGVYLESARSEVAAFVEAVETQGQEHVELLVTGEDPVPAGGTHHRIDYADVWLRDTGPVVGVGAEGCVSNRFRFNGWGGRYLFERDLGVAQDIGNQIGARDRFFDVVLEGGAVETDGQGTLLTTRDCLQNPNRNPGVSESELAHVLRVAYGAEKVIWLTGSLLNDHTDGHIDTLCRFVGPGRVVCMEGTQGDPNRKTLESLKRQLEGARDAEGAPLEVITVPSPNLSDESGAPLPASYLNFYIANKAVIVPVYGSPNDACAAEQIASLFPDRETVALSARAILSGGGAFHCITQQQPESP